MRGRPIDLNALQTLVAVVDEGSMTAAARRLAYSQSAISMQLARLEESLGVTLLRRERGRVWPTGPGEIALGRAREMLAAERSLRDALAEQAIGGILRFGLPADLTPLMRNTWARFALAYPQVEMQVRSELSASLCGLLDTAAIDLAILTLPEGSRRGTLLRREPLLWVAGRGSRAPARSRLALALGPEGGCAFRSAAVAALDDAGRDWRIAYEGQSFAPLASPIGIGLAISVAMPSMLASEPEIEALDAEACGLPPLPEVELRLDARPDHGNAAAEALAALIRADVGIEKA